MKVIGVMGPSYCGSTIVGLALGQLDGVVCAGEVHRLVTYEKWGLRASKKCPERLRQRFGKSFPGWYRHLGAELGATRAFVTTDKNPSIYRLFHPPEVLIFPYKDPRAQVASFIRHSPEKKSIQFWRNYLVDVYCRCILYTMQHNVPVVSMSLTDLSNHPAETFRALTKSLELPYRVEMLNYWVNPPLMFGGNDHVNTWNYDMPDDKEWEKRFHHKIGHDDRWKTELSREDSDYIAHNCQVRLIQTWLTRRKVSPLD